MVTARLRRRVAPRKRAVRHSAFTIFKSPEEPSRRAEKHADILLASQP